MTLSFLTTRVRRRNFPKRWGRRSATPFSEPSEECFSDNFFRRFTEGSCARLHLAEATAVGSSGERRPARLVLSARGVETSREELDYCAAFGGLFGTTEQTQPMIWRPGFEIVVPSNSDANFFEDEDFE